MPYQDTEDEATTFTPRNPTPLERWARKILLEDWNLKLIALAVTVVLWLAISGQNKPITQRSAVQLSFVRPEGMEISNDLPENIEVILKGKPSKLDQIGPRLLATVDITDQRPGERVVRLSDRVQMAIPTGVTIEAFRPASVSIRLEPIAETQAEVEIKFEGSLPEGYEVAGVTINPTRVRLRGPADRIRQLQKVTTESVSLNGRRESFSLNNVAISISDSRIEILEPAVNIQVQIVETNRGDTPQTSASRSSPYIAHRSILLSGPLVPLLQRCFRDYVKTLRY